MTQAQEINFDGIIGSTHNYAGLSPGNVASALNRAQVARPREAALQGLAKMKQLSDLGVPQAVLPPHERPDVGMLRRLGFSGTDAEVIGKVAKESPYLLANVSSASAMWAANSATVSPSADTNDGRVHFTPANNSRMFHRSFEHETTARIFKAIFPEGRHFAHHAALPSGLHFGDEGGANHTRLCGAYGEPGIEFFVYGRDAFDRLGVGPKKFPARHTLEASQAIARHHGLDPRRVVFAQQNPDAIDAGAFHNDVVAVGDRAVLFYHEQAFVNESGVIAELKAKFKTHCGGKDLACIRVAEHEIPLVDAVRSYLFNTQIVALPDGRTAIIAPEECRESSKVKTFLDTLVTRAGSPLQTVRYAEVRQSMKNGGGPACLRLRVVLTDEQRAAANQGVFLNDSLYARLTAWVDKHYRETISPDDLSDPKLLTECRSALDALTGILGLGSIYPFQI